MLWKKMDQDQQRFMIRNSDEPESTTHAPLSFLSFIFATLSIGSFTDDDH